MMKAIFRFLAKGIIFITFFPYSITYFQDFRKKK